MTTPRTRTFVSGPVLALVAAGLAAVAPGAGRRGFWGRPDGRVLLTQTNSSC